MYEEVEAKYLFLPVYCYSWPKRKKAYAKFFFCLSTLGPSLNRPTIMKAISAMIAVPLPWSPVYIFGELSNFTC